METDRTAQGSFSGTVYGDLVGSPYMTENTYNRYFELGETRRAYSHGKVRAFFPQATEVSHGAAAVCRWLSAYRDHPTPEDLQKCLRQQYEAHPGGGWTERMRLFITSGMTSPSSSPDVAAVARAVPVAFFFKGDLPRALDMAEACVRATSTDPETIRMAQAVTHAVHMALDGRSAAEISPVLETQYGLRLIRPEDDMRAELRGEIPEPVMMLGVPVEGAYRYRLPDHPAPLSSRIVTEGALRSVIRSDGWEDAVRRAVSLGGPSNALAGIAGGFAEALYGEVTPTVVGRLFPYVPTDIYHQMESFTPRTAVRPRSEAVPHGGMVRDTVTVISLGQGRFTFIVPEQREDVRALVRESAPGSPIITPGEAPAFLSRFDETRSGTFAYGTRPETLTLYVQDGKRLASPSTHAASGMPSMQERRHHLSAFREFRSWCIDRQGEMNEKAGNPGAGQIHYGDAYHMWIGLRRVDFLFGDTLAGRVSLDGRGLLKVELGEYRDLSPDARFEDHREQAWRSRNLFSMEESADPLGRMDRIKDDILSRLLDEGMRSGTEDEMDVRRLSDEERRDRSPVSNIEHLEPLDPAEDKGLGPDRSESIPGVGMADGIRQPVDTVYSIGYGNRSRESFIGTLEMLGVDTVVDVRSIPRSRYTPQFDEEALFEALQERGIRYLSAGDKLGARPSDPSLYDPFGQVDWERLRESESYREGIRAIRERAADGEAIAVVCSEGDPLSCHRFGTVSRDLAEEGMTVRHVLLNGEVVSHDEMANRLLERYSERGLITSVLSGSYQEQLNEAYKVLNCERGYRKKDSARRRVPSGRIKR